MKAALGSLAALLLFILAAPAFAHDARPLAITITEQQNHRYLAQLRVPPSVAYDNQPSLAWPENCTPALDEEGQPMPVIGGRQVVTCEGGLAGRELSIGYAIYNPSLATLFRLELRDGSVITQLLTPDQQAWTVPQEPSLLQVAQDYLQLGIEHIWTGIDHLLFVAGLLLLAGTMRRVLLAVTGFTIAHSLTLSLAALELVRLPIAPVEAVIALSILFLAREIVAPHPDGLAARHPILVSSSFGLLHGFGFAAVLQEIGLPRGELATGLLSFNIGVEIG
ncbi:MAG TPA: HupE/UreJ family protein, partial [Sphingomonadaceae bacterium]|nr:HupE/UreJ family protein [Sphingomonadaceae bacterium]